MILVVAEQRDTVLFATVERWWEFNREPLAARGVAATLQGAESEAVLFRLVNGFDRRAAKEIVSSSVDGATEEGLTAALASLAERA
jgi:hypothetical protein